MKQETKKMVKRSVIITAVVAFLVMGIVVAAQKIEPLMSTKQDVQATQYLQLSVNGNLLTIDTYQSDLWYDLPMLTTECKTNIVSMDFSGYKVTINGQQINSSSNLQLTIKELNETAPIKVTITTLDGKIVKNYYIRSLPLTMPKMTTVGSSPEKGYYYFTIDNYAIKMDNLGKIVFYKQGVGMDFKRQELQGKVRYSYVTENISQKYPPMPFPIGSPNAKVVIMNEKYNVIKEIPFLTQNGEIGANYPLDGHDFLMLDDNHYFIESYVAKRVENIPANVSHSKFGARVAANVIQEIKDDKLVWQWDSTQHPELYGMSSDFNDYFNKSMAWCDYAHLNSITIDPKDNNLICSFRHLDSILKIDRNSGKILWTLGGKNDDFGLTNKQKFSKQHFARVTENGRITIFDNGNANKQSRVLEIQLDEKNKKIISYEQNLLEKQFSEFAGSAQKLSVTQDKYLVAWGGKTTTNTLFSEIDFTNNKIIFEVIYPVNDSNIEFCYRAYKCQN